MKLINGIVLYLLGLIGIICVSVFPQFISSLGMPDATNYFSQLVSFVTSMVDADSWVYKRMFSPGTAPLFEVLYEPFIYSMKILTGALLLGFVLAFLLALIVQYFRKSMPAIKSILNFLESIPDLIVATILQIISIYVYKKTGISIFEVAGYTDKIYFAPILTLSILPTISMFKILTLMMEEESLKRYVLFLKSKGVSRIGILLKHMFRNIFPGFSQRLKVILWGTLSSQFIIERIFNVQGLTYYLIDSFTPITIFATLFLIFTPFYLFFFLLDNVIERGSVYSAQFQKQGRLQKGNFLSFKTFISHMKDNLLFHVRQLSISIFGLIRRKNRIHSVGVYFKNWKIAIGGLFFIFVIGYSILYSIVADDRVEQIKLLYDEDGSTLIDAPPYAPTEPFVFGSDQYGYSIFDQLVVGAKYTLLFGLLIAFFRVFGGLFFGVIYAFWLNRTVQKWFEKLTDSLHFVPLSMVALVLLTPILMLSGPEFAFSTTERILLEILILTVLVLPLTTVLIGKDIQQVLDQEFILTARTLGGGNAYIFVRHVLPHIRPKLAILLGQQFIQVLLVFIHLGVFELFFGGTKVSLGSMPSSISVTYEWSGLIGAIGRGAIRSGQNWYLWILVAFIVAIFAMQLIIQGIIDIQQRKVGVLYNFKKKKPYQKQKILEEKEPELLPREWFRLVNKG